jgi:hypothetical protein
MSRVALVVMFCLLALGGGVTQAMAADGPPRLAGRAVLPADTFAPGPPSGTLLGTAPINGRTPPFPGQPVQGCSAVLDAGLGAYWAMPDNGFGAKANSKDFLLRMYRITPLFESALFGDAFGIRGRILVGQYLSLRDPQHKIPFPIVNEQTSERLLTGGDFDIESVRRDRHGDLWFGDEFGPFLLHTDASGKVLEAPIALPGVKSPDNPTLAPGETPNLPSSKGFEGMALSADGHQLFASLEGALTTDPDQRRCLIFTFDLDRHSWVSPTRVTRLDAPGDSIGDLTALDDCRLVIIERDNEQGPAARTKRIDRLDLCAPSQDGALVRKPLVNLLDIADPHHISLPARPGDFGLGNPFKFPFQTIEDVLPLAGDRLLVLNDNNYPFSTGRNAGRPDDEEAIVLDVPGLRDGASTPPTSSRSVDVQLVGLKGLLRNYRWV